MKQIKKTLPIQLVSILWLMTIWHTTALTATAEMIFIANPSIEENSITQTQLRDIFLGDKVLWQDGQQITVAINTNPAVFEQFTKKYTGRTTNQFQAYWRLILFTGKGSVPKMFKTDEEIIQYVSNTPGAIGYISSKTEADGIKIIPISD